MISPAKQKGKANFQHAESILTGGFLAVILLVDRFGHLHQWTAGNLYFFFGLWLRWIRERPFHGSARSFC